VATKSTSDKPASSMEELLSRSDKTIKGFSRGDKIDAKLVELGKNFAVFDVGGKSEGILYDVYYDEARDFLSNKKVGDTMTALVIDPETPDGSVLLSLRAAANEVMWETLESARDNNEPISVVVRNVSPKGISVDISTQISAFIPVSQIGKKTAANLDAYLGRSMKARVLEIDRPRRRILLSEKAVSEEKELALEKRTIDHLTEGGIYDGIVKELTPFGAFIEITVPATPETEREMKLEGMVHVSEVSWQKVKEPAEVLDEGQELEVKYLGLRDGKLALSIKQALADPWSKVEEKYAIEQRLKGKVVRQSDFGTFVELEPGVEGLIHITKIPPATRFTVGQEVDVYIEEVDEANRKISLGIVLTSKPVGYK
jgi:small subunit ribosomal protein S1